MRRLMTKFWKEIAYLVGFAVLVVLQLETIGLFYLGAGAVWFVVWLLRNSGGTYDPEPDLIDSRGLYGGYSDYYHRH
ncbi:hypothetical protein [Leisingera sp.]|uniref:hypothetical protein n=1 Tax=Leisingera sp. TaxID=1879318 RepID=UPI002B27030F|nr:hypothetical protein [Leisingera sp.]